MKQKRLLWIWCLWPCAGIAAGALFATLMSRVQGGSGGLAGWLTMTLAVGTPCGLFLGVAGTLWMLSSQGPACPDCGAPLPFLRKPENLRQALWEVSTFPQCGCEMNRKMEHVDSDKEVD
jgi:hypothetical protein